MNKRDASKIFSESLRRKRNALGLSQESLAAKAQVHPTYVGLIERGKRSPTLRIAEKLAHALGTNIQSLLEEGANIPKSG